MEVDCAVAIVASDGTRPAAEIVPPAADRLAPGRHALVLDAFWPGMTQQNAFRTQQEVLPLVVVEVEPAAATVSTGRLRGARCADARACGTRRQRVETGAV